MSISFISFTLTGVVGGGAFIGSIQQNVLKPQKTEYDLLFEEIEKDIKEFSKKYGVDKENLKEIKCAGSKNESKETCKVELEKIEIEDKNTLSVWTGIWMGLLNAYINKLWIGKNTNAKNLSEDLESRIFSEEDKKEALEEAEKNMQQEKEKFEEKLSSAKQEIQEIYKKMKKFLQTMKLPKKYNSSTYAYTPYEEYVKKILEE